MSSEREKLVERAQEILATCLSEWGHPQEAENVLASVDLESYDTELRLISQLLNFGFEDHAHRAAPSPPADAGRGGLDRDALTEVVMALKRACDEGLITNPPGLHTDAVGVLADAANDALTAKAAAPAPVRVSGIPGNVLTHRNAWRKAIEQALAAAAPKTEDTDGRSYWAHELAAFDRTFDRLEQLIVANDAPAPGVGEAVALHREWRSALTLAVEIMESEADMQAEGGHDAHVSKMKRAMAVMRSMLAAAPPAPQGDRLLQIGERVEWQDNVGRWWPVRITGYNHATYNSDLDDGTQANGYARGRFREPAAIAAQAGEVGNG